MTTWTNDELTRIGTAEELQIASLRGNGTLRKPVTIWVVRQGDDLYVRSVNGRTGSWFRGTQTTPRGSHPGWWRRQRRHLRGCRPRHQRRDRRRLSHQVPPLRCKHHQHHREP